MALVLQPRLQIHALLQGWVEAWALHEPPRTLCRIEGLGGRDLQSTGCGGQGGEGYGACANQ